MFNKRAKPTSNLLIVPKLFVDLSIEGTLPIAQSTPNSSFISEQNATTAHDLSRRRRLVRTRVTASDLPVTPLARRRVPVSYSPEVGLGRLVIDETATDTAVPNATVASGDLHISWLSEQHQRLNFPPSQ